MGLLLSEWSLMAVIHPHNAVVQQTRFLHITRSPCMLGVKGAGAVSPVPASSACPEMMHHSLQQTWLSASLCPCSMGSQMEGAVRGRGRGWLEVYQSIILPISFASLMNRSIPNTCRGLPSPPPLLPLTTSLLLSPTFSPHSPTSHIPPSHYSPPRPPSQLKPRDGGWVRQVLPL